MLTKVSSKGQTVIPSAIREMAGITGGDDLEVGYSEGMIVLRKRQPLTPARIKALLLAGRKLPAQTARDERVVRDTVARVRRQASN